MTDGMADDNPFDCAVTSSGFNDKNLVVGGRYRLPDPDPSNEWPTYKRVKKDGSTSWMRATRLGSAIADSYSLSMWSQRMVAHGLAVRPSLYALACSLDPEGDKDEMDTLCDRAKEAASARDASDKGTAIHAFTEQVDRGKKPPIPEQYKADVLAWSTCLAKHGIKIVDNLIERCVIIIELGVAGKWDRVGMLTRDVEILFAGQTHPVLLAAGTHVIIDLKTGRNLQYAWHEIAIQLAIYSHADFIFNADSGAYVLPPLNLSRAVGFVVHLPAGTGGASLHAVDIRRGWRGVRLARKVLDWRAENGLSAPVRGAQDAVRAQRRERLAAALTAISAAPSTGALATLYATLAPAGLWTQALREAAKARRKLLQARP